MKTYKEFINKAKPVELDEAIFTSAAIATAVKTAPVWAPLLKKAVLGTALVGGLGGAAYDYDQKMKGKKGIFPDFTKMFNVGKKDTINDILWRDTSKAKDTNIPDGIKDDLKGQTFQPDTAKVDKTNTEVGDGTAVGDQSAVGGRALPVSALKTGAISQAAVKSKKIPFKSFRLGKPKIGTGHNVGRRVNPQ